MMNSDEMDFLPNNNVTNYKVLPNPFANETSYLLSEACEGFDNEIANEFSMPIEYETEFYILESPKEIVNEDLIKAVRGFPCVWDLQSEDYKNKCMRDKSWEEIAIAINMTAEDVPEIKKKWLAIRGGYKRSKKMTSCGNAPQTKPYKYSRALSFLDHTSEPRKTISLPNLETIELVDVSDIRTRSILSQKRKPDLALPRDNLKLKKQVKNAKPEVRTSEDIFGEYIAMELKSFNPLLNIEAQFNIQQILAEIKLKQLK